MGVLRLLLFICSRLSRYQAWGPDIWLRNILKISSTCKSSRPTNSSEVCLMTDCVLVKVQMALWKRLSSICNADVTSLQQITEIWQVFMLRVCHNLQVFPDLHDFLSKGQHAKLICLLIGQCNGSVRFWGRSWFMVNLCCHGYNNKDDGKG